MKQWVKKYDEELDAQDLVLEIMKNRKMKGNASYLAFTATKKHNFRKIWNKTKKMEHLNHSSLLYEKQAIEEGFILDVLSNYTTYRSYYEIEKINRR